MKRISPSKSLVLSVAFVAAALACTPAFAAKKSKIAEDDGMSLMEMSDQLDQLDKQDFQEAIERATSCTRMRDFSCAESELAKAAKVANGGQDKKILLASRQSLANERQELANETRRAEEARRREEEADREREEQRRRAEEAEDDSSYSASNDIVMHILQKGQENAAMMADLNRQTRTAYAETNRRLAEQAAERARAREEREEREAERRRDAERDRAREQRVAETRERDEASARERRAAEESRAQHERERMRQRATSRPTQPSSMTLVSSASPSTGSSAQNVATRTRQPHQPYADPDPYENHRNGWGGSHSSGKGQTREAACNEAKSNSQEEIARHSANWRFDAISPCVCSVNVGADRSMLDAMAETGQPDQWTCWQYEKKTQIRDLGNRSK